MFKHGRLARLMIPKERLEFRSVEEAKRSFDEARRTPPKFVCPKCEAVTFHPEDVRQRYCGRCHLFADDWDRDYPK